MVALRVPFRGYLIEGRLSGRLAEGQSASEVEAWLQTAAPGVHARVKEDPSGGCGEAEGVCLKWEALLAEGERPRAFGSMVVWVVCSSSKVERARDRQAGGGAVGR